MQNFISQALKLSEELKFCTIVVKGYTTDHVFTTKLQNQNPECDFSQI